MAETCRLYYITDRTAFPGDESTRRHRLLDKIAEATLAGVDYIQLREKDLSTRDLESLAREAIQIIQKLRTENQELRTSFCHQFLSPGYCDRSGDEIHQRQRQQELPAKCHQLVVTEARQRAAHPDIQKEKYKNLRHEPDDR